MPRRPQKSATKGSQFWTQELVNQHPDVLEKAIDAQPIAWSSPLASDDYSEYWDDSFVDRLQLTLTQRSLSSFWPRSGPRWDALGRVAGGAAIMLEAKSHIAEMASVCRAAPRARLQIERAFAEVWRGWRVVGNDAWFTTHYQYANRLAHAYLLNELNAAPTFLVFLHMVGDSAMNGPTTSDEWKAAVDRVHDALGVRHRLPPYVVHAFVDVSGSRPFAA